MTTRRCPECGSKKLELEYTINHIGEAGTTSRIKCLKCGSSGPYIYGEGKIGNDFNLSHWIASTKASAHDAWTKRIGHSKPPHLVPCPYCGEAKAITPVCAHDGYRIQCQNCGLHGPLWHELRGARERWNDLRDRMITVAIIERDTAREELKETRAVINKILEALGIKSY